MTPTRSYIAAAVLLTIGGVLVGVAASAIVLAGAAVQAGIAVQPADARLLDDLGAVLPFIVAFAVLDLATAVGLARGRSWAIVSASLVALGAAGMGALRLAIVLLGNDPSAITGAARLGSRRPRRHRRHHRPLPVYPPRPAGRRPAFGPQPARVGLTTTSPKGASPP